MCITAYLLSSRAVFRGTASELADTVFFACVAVLRDDVSCGARLLCIHDDPYCSFLHFSFSTAVPLVHARADLYLFEALSRDGLRHLPHPVEQWCIPLGPECSPSGLRNSERLLGVRRTGSTHKQLEAPPLRWGEDLQRGVCESLRSEAIINGAFIRYS